MTVPFAGDSLHAVLLADPDLVAVVSDHSGTVTWINEAAAAIGWQLGDDARAVLPSSDAGAYPAWMTSSTDGDVLEVRGGARPGTTGRQTVLWRIVNSERDPPQVVWLGRDATGDFALAGELAERTLDLDELVRLGTALADATTAPVILDELSASLRILTGADSVFLSVIIRERRALMRLEPSGLSAVDPGLGTIERDSTRVNEVFVVAPGIGDLPFDPGQAMIRQALCGTFAIDDEQRLVAMAWRRNEGRSDAARRLSVVMAVGRQAAMALARASLLARLEWQSLTDPLTGLDNRRSFDRRLAQTNAAAQRLGQEVAIFAVDLDNFKQTNDRFGHAAGDAALVSVAEHLRRVMRSEDLVARVGGDEFVVAAIVPDETVAQRTADRLVDRNDPGARDRPPLTVGIAIGDRDRGLLQQADAALYRAKAAGKGGWCLAPRDPNGAPPSVPVDGASR